MNNRLLNALKSAIIVRVPRQLPTSPSELKSFVEAIRTNGGVISGLTEESVTFAVCNMLMHLGPTTNKAPLKFFIDSIKKSVTNEIAYGRIQELKEAQKKAKDEQPVQNQTVS